MHFYEVSNISFIAYISEEGKRGKIYIELGRDCVCLVRTHRTPTACDDDGRTKTIILFFEII